MNIKKAPVDRCFFVCYPAIDAYYLENNWPIL